MDFKSIQELIKTVSESKLSTLEIEADGIKIKMEKKEEQVLIDKVSYISQAAAQDIPMERDQRIGDSVITVDNESMAVRDQEVPKKQGTIITSPIVGTFYSSPGPDSSPFVEIGSKVQKGDVLCIIEAMKLMNEIEAEIDGEVAEIFVKAEDMVEYGQPLFRII